MTVNDFFDRVFCINLDSRPDRWQQSSVLFQQLGIDVERIPAVQGSATNLNWPFPLKDGAIGCALSQLFTFKYARQLQLDNFLLFEDDIEFADNFNAKFADCVTQLPDDWDIVYFSGNHHLGPNLTQITDQIYKCEYTLAAHSVGFRHTMFDYFINTIIDLTKPCDVHYAESHRSFNAYVVQPHITGQRSDFSNIENTNVDYKFM